jgi:nitrate reductase delta subunit
MVLKDCAAFREQRRGAERGGAVKEDKRRLLKLISFLLTYPGEELKDYLEVLGEMVKEIPHPGERDNCRLFLKYLEDAPLISLQEEYTATFDLDPAVCLNLTYHRWGDNEERGRALAGFRQIYYSAGYESSTGELPDYLPLVLEFLSLDQQQDCFSCLGEYHKQVETISARLRENGSPYAGILEIVANAFREIATEGESRT